MALAIRCSVHRGHATNRNPPKIAAKMLENWQFTQSVLQSIDNSVLIKIEDMQIVETQSAGVGIYAKRICANKKLRTHVIKA